MLEALWEFLFGGRRSSSGSLSSSASTGNAQNAGASSSSSQTVAPQASATQSASNPSFDTGSVGNQSFDTTSAGAQSEFGTSLPQIFGGQASTGSFGNVHSVPEIDASSGLLAIAAVLATLLLVWEIKRRNFHD